jgi:hypothetical protein
VLANIPGQRKYLPFGQVLADFLFLHLILDPDGKKNRWFAFANYQITFISKRILLIISKNLEKRVSSCIRFHVEKGNEFGLL